MRYRTPRAYSPPLAKDHPRPFHPRQGEITLRLSRSLRPRNALFSRAFRDAASHPLSVPRPPLTVMKQFRVRKPRAALSRALLSPTRASRCPRPLGVSLARFSSSVAMLAALAGGAASSKATTLYWDADNNPYNNILTGTGLGGTGLWD